MSQCGAYQQSFGAWPDKGIGYRSGQAYIWDTSDPVELLVRHAIQSDTAKQHMRMRC